jgi:hypothetical protein
MIRGRTLSLLAILLSGALLAGMAAGCAWSIGEKKTNCAAAPPPGPPIAPTRGQQLIDLKKARDQGAITEDEYQAQKKKLLDH